MHSVAIIDADFVHGGNNRFPNLACLKMSAYYKREYGNAVLLTDYTYARRYNQVFVSKVFSNSEVHNIVYNEHKIVRGGTGFFYDKAPELPYHIEHSMPDYSLYDSTKIVNEYFRDYSIGFTTRHCFRRCPFCVNKNYTKVERHSPVTEFFDERRKYICLLDDNILGYPDWQMVLDELKDTGRHYQFKQGMDMRLMTNDKATALSNAKYKGDFIFAFDNIKERDLMEDKLSLWRQHNSRSTKLYVLCGYDREDKYDRMFWLQDIIDTMERIVILMKHSCIPYLMRYDKYLESPYSGLYIELARWCNQPSHFKKMSFEDFCFSDPTRNQTPKRFKEFYDTHPDIASKYFRERYKDI